MATDSRRSTAAQFFMEEEAAAVESMSTYDRVVELINQTSLLQKDSTRLVNLRVIQELIVQKEPALLDNFLDEMLAFQNDRSQEVRKFVINFMEEACKKDPEIVPKVVGHILLLLQDENVSISKKVMLSMTTVYKVTLQWLAKSKKLTEVMEHTWECIEQMKSMIMDMLDSENDGVRTHAIKFLETIIIVLSKRTADSDVPKRMEGDISLDQISEQHPLLNIKKLEDEGRRAFEAVIAYMGSQHVSSVNLMTCMNSMTTIAKMRPHFMVRVVQAFETLHVNLPPTLAKSQVSSVRKNLKMQMLALLRQQAAYDYQSQITTLLTDLGAKESEVIKAMPKIDPSRKRKAEESAETFKKPKLEQPSSSGLASLMKDEDDDYGMTPFVGSSSFSKSKPPESSEDQKQTAIDITAEDLISRLTAQNVADLVLLSMVMLPDSMPVQFQATYTPIAAAGTAAQIKHLARLLATQLTAASLGKGISEVQMKLKTIEESEEAEEGSSPKHTIKTVVGGSTEKKLLPPVPQMVPPPPPQQTARKGIKHFKLSAVTKPLAQAPMGTFATAAYRRILQAEKAAVYGCAASGRMKILVGVVSLYGGPLKDELQNFIFNDLRNRADLALAWIYQEYANYQGYNVASAAHEKPTIASYDECLTRLLSGLLERPDRREGLFSRLILEAPLITQNAIQVLRKYCQDENRIYLGMTTLKELIIKRPCMKLEFLDVLLDFTSHERLEVRNNAIRVVKKLHERSDLKSPIENSALYFLKFLLQPAPPQELFGPGKGRGEIMETWTEESMKLCLYLYLGLLPVNHALIHELAVVYTAATADIKRTILRVLENPVKGMGMQSPELLLLVENCPKGAETLVTRIIHILTDKAAPSPELVERVRDLYQKRVSDVRFLIPVLNGLTKKEVIGALPKLIKLNPVVVKEVFNRLLGSHNQESSYSSPLNPSELLVALHNVDTSKVDMKTIIKACNLCFSEKVYTQEVLAVVMQQLMEQSPLPTLLMRTVIQSLAMYPKLIGFVMNIMQRLIVKQVWKQKKVWEGFVKCCQRTKPQSFQVLLQLPAPQLKNAFEISPELREPLHNHVQSFTPHQRAHIPKAIMMILEKDPTEEARLAEKVRKEKEEEERLAAQERLYQQKLEEERRKQLGIPVGQELEKLPEMEVENLEDKGDRTKTSPLVIIKKERRESGMMPQATAVDATTGQAEVKVEVPIKEEAMETDDTSSQDTSMVVQSEEGEASESSINSSPQKASPRRGRSRNQSSSEQTSSSRQTRSRKPKT